MLPNRGGPVSSSSSAATLLLFLFVSLPLPLPLLATRAPDQYDAPTAHHHHGLQPKEVLRSIKLQSTETGLQQQPAIPPAVVQESHNGPPLHSIKLQHSEYSPSPSTTPQRNDKLSSLDHNKRSVDDATSQIHRVKLTKSDYQQTGSLLPLHASQQKQKGEEEKNQDTIHYEGDDDITIDEVKSLDATLTAQEELDINVDDNNVPTLYSDIRRAKREQQDSESVRQKRDFIRWYGASSFQTYRPQYISSYQFSGHSPYFIPVWGNPSRIPVFFPIKPILFNPGYPVANPPQPTQQPNIPTTEPPTDGNVNIGNRINTDFIPDGPSWGIVETPSTSINNNNNNNGGVPQVPNTQNRKPPTPSLLHRPSRTDADDEIDVNARPITQIPNELRPTQNTPQFGNDNRDPLFDVANNQPQFTQTVRTTTRRPQTGNNQPGQQAREPSRCVWAVISCCSPLNTNIRYSCFEQLGCNGPFWDGNPCSLEYKTAALNAAKMFYEQTSTRR